MAFDDGHQPDSARILGVYDTENAAVVCALKSLLSTLRYPMFGTQISPDLSHHIPKKWKVVIWDVTCDLRVQTL
jgi:hypothetical protein